MNELEQLKQENTELKAQIKMRDSYSCSTCKGFGSVMIAIDDGMDCPECVQRDNDIKADAINSLTEQGYGYSVEIGGCTDEWVISVDQILEHAEKLRNKQ